MQKLAALFLIACGSALAGPPYPSVQKQTIAPPIVGPKNFQSFGYAIDAEGSRVAVGQPGAAVGGAETGIVAIFDAATGEERLMIPNPDRATLRHFGGTLQLSGDLLVVGSSPGWDEVQTRVHVFDLSSTHPDQPVHSLSTNETEPDFGRVVAIKGQRVAVASGDTLLVYDLDAPDPGVPQWVIPAPPDRGYGYKIASLAMDGSRIAVGGNLPIADELDDNMVHIYDLDGPFPEVPVYALHAPGFYGAGFGGDVALQGNRLIVGAEWAEHDPWRYGSVFGYDLDGSSPTTPVLVLPPPDVEIFSHFGRSVDLSGDHVLVGSPWLGEERAYLYDVTGFEEGTASTVPERKFGASAAEIQPFFGAAVAIGGDRAFVGAIRNWGGYFTDEGKTFSYDLSASDPVASVTELETPVRTGGSRFGATVALSARWGLAVGGKSDMPDGGNAWFFDTLSPDPSDTVRVLKWPQAVPANAWVSALAIDGHLAITGMPYDDLVLVYALDSASPDEPVATLAPPAPSNLEYGAALAVSGHIVVVGEPGPLGGSGGQVWIYDLANASPAVPILSLQDPQPSSRRLFGRSVAVLGKTVVVAGSVNGLGSGPSSHVYFYDLDSATPQVPIRSMAYPESTPVAVAFSGSHLVVSEFNRLYGYRIGADGSPTAVLDTWVPYNDTYYREGHRVSLDGSVFAVPNWYSDSPAPRPVAIYDLEAPDSTVSARCYPPSSQPNHSFGSAVAMRGGRLLVGAPEDNTGFYNDGTVMVFGAHPSDEDADHLPDSWEIQHFGSIGAQKPWDDFDADGASNVLEYAFGSNPAMIDAVESPPPVIENDHLTLTVNKVPGVAYLVSCDSSTNGFEPEGAETLAESATLLKVRDRVAISDAPRRFMRVFVWDTALPFP